MALWTVNMRNSTSNQAASQENMTVSPRTRISLAVIASLWPCFEAVAQPELLAQPQTGASAITGSIHPTRPAPALPTFTAQVGEVTQSTALGPADRDRLNQLLAQAQSESWTEQPFPQLIQSIAEQFLGADYRAGLLDNSASETLVLSLEEFDCVLFIETILSLGKAILQPEGLAPSPANMMQQQIASTTFSNSVENYRYRDGKLQNYCDRLHYFSDWILDNQRRGNVASIPKLQVQPLNKTLRFMGNHRSSYPQLKSDSQYHCIRKVEHQLNQAISRHSPDNEHFNNQAFGYIPTAQIRNQYQHLQAGDIVAVATSIPGLDVTHTGLAYRHPNGNIGLIHAAPNAGVILATDLQTYIERVDSAIGIIVTRPTP